MATDDGDFVSLGVGVRGVRREGRCPHDVQGSDAKETRRVKHACSFESLRCDGDGGVDGVGDDAADCLGACCCDFGKDGADDVGICLCQLERVVLVRA